MLVEETDEDKISCHNCGDEIIATEVYNHGVKDYCQKCFHENFFSCAGCTDYYENDDAEEVDDYDFCPSCISEMPTCERCNQICRDTDYMHYVTDDSGGYDWCDTCYEYSSYYCDCCNESHTTYNCWRARSIHSYSYVPDDLTFRWLSPYYDNIDADYNEPHGNHVFMGFEVEVESNGKSLQNGTSLFDSVSNYLYLKSDGSLNDGFEIVSHPSTLDVYHKLADKLFTPFNELSKIGYAAWRTTTCGMHVHVSRKAFSNKAHLWRFAWMFNCNPESFKIFAGRDAHRWATFDGQKKKASKIIAGKAYYPERYAAVNLSNAETVEIRIFRSSLLPRRILSNLGMVDCVVEFTRNMTVKDVNDHKDSWSDFVQFILSRPEPKYEAVQYYVRKYFKEFVLETAEGSIVDSDN